MQAQPSLPTKWLYGISFLLSAAIAFQLFSDEFLRGWDSYYYALQIDAWFKNGFLKYPDGNLVHLLVTPLKLFGLGAENTLRLWVSLSQFLFLVSFIRLLRFIKTQDYVLFIFSWAALSPLLMYISLALPKTFAFLLCFNFVFYYSLKKKTNYILWTLFACLSVILHKVAIVYVSVSALYLLWNKGDRIPKKAMVAVLGTAAVFVAWQLFGNYAVHWGDLTRLDLSAGLLPGVFNLVFRMSFPFALKLETISSLLIISILFVKFRHLKEELFFSTLLLFPSFCPALGPGALNFGERFGILFPYFSLLSCILILKEAPSEQKKPLVWTFRTKLLMLVFLCGLGYFRLDYGHPESHVVKHEKTLPYLCALKDKDIPLLIAGKTFSYFYKFKTGKETFSFYPEDHWDKTLIWRLFTGASPEEVKPFLPAKCQAYVLSLDENPACGPMPSPSFLIREDCYALLRETPDPEISFPFFLSMRNDVNNPYQKRPAFLYRKYTKYAMEDPFPACPPEGC